MTRGGRSPDGDRSAAGEGATDGGRPRDGEAPSGFETGDLVAMRCPDGHLTHPPHPRCPSCGAPPTGGVDLADRTGTVVTWTVATAAPPGVREPNPLAIVAFEVDGREVRTVGQLVADAEVGIGDAVRPVPVEELRTPGAGIREPDSQSWSGYRFEPVRDRS